MSKLLKDGPFVLSFATHTMILVLQMCEQDFETTILQVCYMSCNLFKKRAETRNSKDFQIKGKKRSTNVLCIGMHGGYTG